MDMEKLMTPKKFSLAVEQVVQECGCSHMEAVLDYCEKHSIEPDTVKPLITKSLKEKIECNIIQTPIKNKLLKNRL